MIFFPTHLLTSTLLIFLKKKSHYFPQQIRITKPVISLKPKPKTDNSSKSLFSSHTLTSPSPKPKTHPFLPPKSKAKTQILPPPLSPPRIAATTDGYHCIFWFCCIMQLILCLLLFSIENQTPYPMPR